MSICAIQHRTVTGSFVPIQRKIISQHGPCFDRHNFMACWLQWQMKRLRKNIYDRFPNSDSIYIDGSSVRVQFKKDHSQAVESVEKNGSVHVESEISMKEGGCCCKQIDHLSGHSGSRTPSKSKRKHNRLKADMKVCGKRPMGKRKQKTFRLFLWFLLIIMCVLIPSLLLVYGDVESNPCQTEDILYATKGVPNEIHASFIQPRQATVDDVEYFNCSIPKVNSFLQYETGCNGLVKMILLLAGDVEVNPGPDYPVCRGWSKYGEEEINSPDIASATLRDYVYVEERTGWNTINLVDWKQLPAVLEDLEELEQLLIYNHNEVPLESIPQLHKIVSLEIGSDYSRPLQNSWMQTIQQMVSPQKLRIHGYDLSQCVDKICSLTSLETLSMIRANLSSLPAGIGALHNLKLLELSYNKFTLLPEVTSELNNLQTLGLKGNHLTLLSEDIRALDNLQTLDLSENQLESLPEGISALNYLKTLDLSKNQLTSLPEVISALNNLQTLNLSENQLKSLPVGISALNYLKTLDLSKNQLTSLPEVVGALNNLQTLDLNENQLISLPEGISTLHNLQTLNLSANKLASLPICIIALKSLQTLVLSNNTIKLIPSSIQSLQSLQKLEIWGNPITHLPVELSDLPQLKEVKIVAGSWGTGLALSLVQPPIELCKQGTPAILQYLKDLKESAVPVKPSRQTMHLTGEYGGGKTSGVKQNCTTLEQLRLKEIGKRLENIFAEITELGNTDGHHLHEQILSLEEEKMLSLTITDCIYVTSCKTLEGIADLKNHIIQLAFKNEVSCRLHASDNNYEALIRVTCKEHSSADIANTHHSKYEKPNALCKHHNTEYIQLCLDMQYLGFCIKVQVLPNTVLVKRTMKGFILPVFFYKFERRTDFRQSYEIYVYPVLTDYLVRMAIGPPLRPGEEFCCEAIRLESFQTYPQWVPVSVIKLVKSGFSYTGHGDEVLCFSCGGRLKTWRHGDEPNVRHRQTFPKCKFMNGRDTSNIPLGGSSNRTDDRSDFDIPPSDNLLGSNSYNFYYEGRPGMRDEDDPMRVDEMRMKIENNRLQTYTGWPRSAPVFPDELSRNGFYYTGVDDRVQCAFCRGILRHWEHGDRVDVEHRHYFPECGFVRDEDVGNISLSSELPTDCSGDSQTVARLGINNDCPKNPCYAMLQHRLTTYETSPSTIRQRQEQLADAGFYYAGFSDNVKCFFCDGGLRNWERNDDPWTEHARWFPRCGYVLREKGETFIRSISEHYARFYPENTHVETGEQTASAMPGTETKASITNCTGVEHVVEPRDIKARMDTDKVKTVLRMGYSRNIVKTALEIQLKTKGDDFPSVQSLMEAIFEIETNQNNAGAPTVATKVSEPATSHTKIKETEPKRGSEKIQAETEHSTLEFNSSLKELESAEQENLKLREERTCRICKDANSNVVFLPCGHLVSCQECAQSLKNCPICRSNIRGTVKTYMS